jgi:hypothetical protein
MTSDVTKASLPREDHDVTYGALEFVVGERLHGISQRRLPNLPVLL